MYFICQSSLFRFSSSDIKLFFDCSGENIYEYHFSKGFPCVELLVGNFVVVRFLYLDILVGSEGLFPIFMDHLAFNVYNVVYKAARRASHQNCPLPNCAVHPSSLKLPLYAK